MSLDLGFDKDIDAHVQALTASMGEITAMAQKVNSQGNRGPGGRFMYYKKADTSGEPGYIVVASAHPSQVPWYAKRGMIPLYQFGDFEDFEKAENWSFRSEPYRRILEKGGVSLFPLQQIVERGWDRKPPLPNVHFPQLDGVTVERKKCSYCARDFLTLEDLQAHESIRHTTTSSQTSLARHLTEANKVTVEALLASQQALAARQSETDGKLADALALIGQALAAQAQSLGVAPEPAKEATASTPTSPVKKT